MATADTIHVPAGGSAKEPELKAYKAELPLGALTVGVDNIHHDVYLSPLWTEQTRTYLLEQIRQAAGLTATTVDKRNLRQTKPKAPTPGEWRRQTLELLQNSLTRGEIRKAHRARYPATGRGDQVFDAGDCGAVCGGDA